MHAYRLVDIFSNIYKASWPVGFSCNVDNNVNGYQKSMGGHASQINVGSSAKGFLISCISDCFYEHHKICKDKLNASAL